MPRLTLRPGETYTVGSDPLSISASGSAVGALRVTPVRESGALGADEIIRHSKDSTAILTLQHLIEPVTIRLEPASATRFDSGQTIMLSLRSLTSGDQTVIVLTEVDLSSLQKYDILNIIPTANGHLELHALGKRWHNSYELGDGSDDPTPEAPLGGIVKIAHDVARAKFDAGKGSTIDLRVVVDASASMTKWMSDESLTVALSILGGIDYALGKDHTLDFRLSTDPPKTWKRLLPNEVGDVVTEQLRSTIRTSGFVAPESSSRPNEAQVVVTDLVPVAWNPAARDCCLLLCRPESIGVLDKGQNVIAMNVAITANPDKIAEHVTDIATRIVDIVMGEAR